MPPTDANRRVQEQFGRNPQGYVTSAVHASGSDLPRLLELIRPQPDWMMLDIATGGGHTARVFAPEVSRVIAGDLTLAMLLAAREHISAQSRNKVTFHRLDALALPYAGEQFDLVVCRMAAHHFPDLGQFLQECVRVVRPGRIVAVVDQLVPKHRKAARYVNAFDRLRDPSHVWAYSLPRWEGFFKDAGLAVWHKETFEQRHDLAPWAARMHCAPPVVTRLKAMIVQAPQRVVDWLQPDIVQGGDITFSIHQAIILGRKTGV